MAPEPGFATTFGFSHRKLAGSVGEAGAVRGDDRLKIEARAGHRDFSTTEGYIRAVEQHAGVDFGEVLAALPAGLVEYPTSVPAGPGSVGGGEARAQKPAPPTRIELVTFGLGNRNPFAGGCAPVDRIYPPKQAKNTAWSRTWASGGGPSSTATNARDDTQQDGP
jgi:hypothetical protein